MTRNVVPAPPDRCTPLHSPGAVQVGLAEVREPAGTGRRRAPAATGPQEYLGTRGARFAISPGSAWPGRRRPGGGRRVGRDHPAVGADGRRRQRRVDGAGRPDLLKRQYSEPHWSAERVGDGVREGSLSASRSSPAPGQLRPDQPQRGPGDLHPSRPGRGQLADPAPLLRAQPGATGRGRGAGGTHPTPRPRGRRRDVPRLLRRPVPTDRVRGPLRRLVEAGPTENPDLLTLTRDDLITDRPRRTRPPSPTTWRAAARSWRWTTCSTRAGRRRGDRDDPARC